MVIHLPTSLAVGAWVKSPSSAQGYHQACKFGILRRISVWLLLWTAGCYSFSCLLLYTDCCYVVHHHPLSCIFVFDSISCWFGYSGLREKLRCYKSALIMPMRRDGANNILSYISRLRYLNLHLFMVAWHNLFFEFSNLLPA